MRKIAGFLLMAGLLAVGLWNAGSGGRLQAGELVMASDPKPPPHVSFSDADGKALGLDDFRGKVVILDYWATWCPPCRAEFPALDRLQGRLEGKGVVVVAVSLDKGDTKRVERFYKDLHVAHLGKFYDQKNMALDALGLDGIPTTLIIDREGREVARVEGMLDWNGAAFDAKLAPFL